MPTSAQTKRIGKLAGEVEHLQWQLGKTEANKEKHRRLIELLQRAKDYLMSAEDEAEGIAECNNPER